MAQRYTGQRYISMIDVISLHRLLGLQCLLTNTTTIKKNESIKEMSQKKDTNLTCSAKALVMDFEP